MTDRGLGLLGVQAEDGGAAGGGQTGRGQVPQVARAHPGDMVMMSLTSSVACASVLCKYSCYAGLYLFITVG